MADYKLYKGRPETNEGRLDKEIRCYDLLDSLGMEYWRTDHPDAQAFTMEACRDIDAVLGAVVCKNLFLTNRQHTAYYLLLMPGDKVFKTKELSSQINSARLSFGSAGEMEEMLDCTPSLSQAVEMKKLAQAGKLKAEDVVTIMSRLKANQQDKLTFRKDTFEAYFPKGYTARQMEESIINMLKERKRQLDRRRDEAR